MKPLQQFMVVLVWSNVIGAQFYEEFIADIIGKWHLRLPTVVVEEDMLELCLMRERVLCLPSNLNLVADHLTLLHLNRMQDGVIFVGSDCHSRLLKLVTQKIFRSNCPVFMPLCYSNEIKLRLDSNIIFYVEQNTTQYQLIDIFAVKGGPLRSLRLGSWTRGEGMALEGSINRWDRRNDLTGATFVNSARNNDHYAVFRRNKDGKILYSWGMLQYMLGIVVVEKLNMTVKHIEIPDGRWLMFDNGSWTGGIGVLQRREADIVSVFMGIDSHRCSVIDCSVSTLNDPITLISAIPKSSTFNMWVYVHVFGVTQWIIFFALLVACVLMMILANTWRKGSSEQSKLRMALEVIATAYLFTIQLGEHVHSAYTGTRLLILTTSMLTLLMFIHYTTDITAEMTSGTPTIPIRTFEDVIHHDYKVIVPREYYGRILAAAKVGTAKYEVYKKYIEKGQEENNNVVKRVIAEPKTLFYGSSSSIVPGRLTTEAEKALYDQVVALKMDDSVDVMAAYGLQKDSEFLDLLNHYILKEIEHGIISRTKRRYSMALYVKEQFGMAEPRPLGYENVIFAFACLGAGVVAAMLIAVVEFLVKC